MPELPSDQRWHLIFTQASLVFALKITVFVTATFIVFFQDLSLIFTDALQSETTSYILAVPFIFAYLVYRKRKILRAVMPLRGEEQPGINTHLSSIAGILIVATAVLLYSYGSYTFTPLEYHMFALPLFAAGMCLILFNPQTLRHLAFPIVFLFFLMPPPTEILYAAGSTLQILSAEASNAIANFFRVPSTLTADAYGNPLITITRPDGSLLPFSVDIACSGIYSLIGFIVFAAFVAYITRDELWKKIALIILGIPLVYFLNIIRITAMLFIGYSFGSDLALQMFHLLGGWVLIFLGTLFLLMISEKAFKTQIFSKPTKKCIQCNPKPQSDRDYCRKCGRIHRPARATLHKTDLAKLSAIILVTGLILLIQAPVFALTMAPPIVTTNTTSGRQFSTQIFPEANGYTLTFLYEDTEFEALAKQDLSLIYLYTPLNQSSDPIWVALEIATTPSSLHRWEGCLITTPLSRGIQPKVSQIDLRDVQLTQNPPIISRYFVFNYTATNETQAVIYWFETTAFIIDSTSQEKHVKTSLIAYPQNMDELPTLKNQLVALATTITNYWQPTKTWYETTLFISKNGNALSATTSIALALTIVYYEVETKKRKETSLLASAKLTKSTNEIVKAVQETKQPATLENIALTLRTNTRTREQLEQRLRELEKMGIIRSSVWSQNDEPIQAWKT